MFKRNIRVLILICFFFSGMAGLIYEVLWVRQLGLVFGTTLYAVSAVLAVFMAGLALGSFLFGRLADRTDNPLRLFALLEVGIGLYVLAIPFIFKGLTALQVTVFQQLPEGHFGLTLIRIALCFLVLLIPTTLMGGTLPVIAKFFVRKERELGSGVGNLYFINTLGAVLGSFLAGFALIPLIGVMAATFMAASVDLAIGVGFFLLQRRLAREELVPVVEASPASPLAKEPRKSRRRREIREVAPYSRALRITVLVGFSLAGLASLSLEVSWTRVLALVLGSSVYAFSLMLTAFLLGIALGSSIMARFIDRRKNLWLDFLLVEALIGISIIVLNPLLGQLPLLFVKVFSGLQESFWALQTVQFLLCFAIMLIPTILMGAAFPIAARIYTQDIKHLGGSVGRLYAGNTFGAMVGPLLTGFVIIPLLGIQWSISLVAAIYLAIAGAVFVLGLIPRRMVKGIAAGALATVAVVGFFLPTWATWDKGVLTSGVYLYYEDYLKDTEGSLRHRMTEGSYILFYKEGLQATVSVSDQPNGDRTLRIDGKVDATSYGDLSTELMLGHLPMLLHPEPKRVLLVGLGSGITLGAVEQHPSLETVEAVEIEPAVVEAASYFAEAHHNALDHPKLKMVVADGRNYVLASTEQYDVITAEPSNPWMSGSSILFTREQFELYSERLSEDGIICQWIHFYAMGTQDLKTVLNTFRSVFPHTTLWGRDVDLLLIGSQSELSIDFQALTARLQQEDVLADLERIDIEDPYGVLGLFLMDEQSLESYCAGAPLHTDDRPILEFSAPKNLYKPSIHANLESMELYIGSVSPLLTNVDDPDGAESKIQSYIDFREHLQQAMIFTEQENGAEAINKYKEALAADANNALMNRLLGMSYMAQGQLDEAIPYLEEAIELNPSYAPCYVYLGHIYFALEKQYDDALEVYEKALELISGNAFLYYGRGYAYQKLGDVDQAIADYNTAIELYPGYADAYSSRGLAYLQQSDFDRSISDLSKAIQLDPELTVAYINRGTAYFYKWEYDKAIADYSKAILLNPTASTYANLGFVYGSKGDFAQAIAEFSNAIQLDPNYAEAYFYRGQAWKDLGISEFAIDDFTSAIELEPDFAEAYFYRGQAHMLLDMDDEAIADFTSAIQLNPYFAEAYFYRGQAYMVLGMDDEAIADFKDCIELVPGTTLAQYAQQAIDAMEE